jgi:hypothetical protein
VRQGGDFLYRDRGENEAGIVEFGIVGQVVFESAGFGRGLFSVEVRAEGVPHVVESFLHCIPG